MSGEGALHRITDIETPASAAEVSLITPPAITVHLVFGIEPALFDETHYQTKRHRSVIGPLTWLKIMWTTANHVRNQT